MKRIAIGAAVSVLAAMLAKRLPLGGVRHWRRPLANLTKDELYHRAQEADIPGRSGMSKDELIEALGGSHD